MELVFLEYFFPRLIPHKVNIALSGRYYWKLLKALGQYGLILSYNYKKLANKRVTWQYNLWPILPKVGCI